jgi:hypothetical protein
MRSDLAGSARRTCSEIQAAQITAARDDRKPAVGRGLSDVRCPTNRTRQRAGRTRAPSFLRAIGGAVLGENRVLNSHAAGLLRHPDGGARPLALQRAGGARRRTRQHGCCGAVEVESPVTVRVRAKKLEERACRRMHRVGLGTRRRRSRVFKFQVHANPLDVRKCAAQRTCGGSAAQPALPVKLTGRLGSVLCGSHVRFQKR